MKRPLVGLSAVLLNACLMLNGCGSSPPTHFYVLSNLPRPAHLNPNAAPDIAVGVGPVDLPEYLDKPQIVTRTGQNGLNLAEFDKWGESLKDNTSQVLAENPSILLPSKKVHAYPWKRSDMIEYQVLVNVSRFDHTEGGGTVLNTRWSILSGDGKTELYAKEASYVEHPAGADYSSIVAAMDRALAQFSRDIATTLNGLATEGKLSSP